MFRCAIPIHIHIFTASCNKPFTLQPAAHAEALAQSMCAVPHTGPLDLLAPVFHRDTKDSRR